MNLKALKLKDAAFKTTVKSVMVFINQDKENIVNPLTNLAMDDFSAKEIKNIQEKYNKSQLYRRIAVMKAQEIAAELINFKHQIQQEQLLAMELLRENKAS